MVRYGVSLMWKSLSADNGRRLTSAKWNALESVTSRVKKFTGKEKAKYERIRWKQYAVIRITEQGTKRRMLGRKYALCGRKLK